jgi:cation diffusion facilitator family transporter
MHTHGNHHNDSYRQGERGAIVGIFTNLGLFFFKGFAGIFGSSHAMVADALHTASDLLTSIGVLIGFKIAKQPADAHHPYGHGKAESIMAKLVSLTLIIWGAKIAYDAIRVIVAQDFIVPHRIALWAAVVSILVKESLFQYTRFVGKKISSTSLMADAWHHRTDALSSVAALMGIAGARMGMCVLDPIAGFVVAAFVIKIGFTTFHKAYDELMDASLPESLMGELRKLVWEVEGVKQIKNIKARKLGIDILVDMTVDVEGSMSVEKAHQITAKIRRNILTKMPNAKDVFIHVEPYKEG